MCKILIEDFVSNQWFFKSKIAREIRKKKAFPAFQGPFSQISIKVDVSFLSMIIPIIVCNFEHIWYLSLSSQNIFHVCTYFAQNIHMSNQTPWTMYNNQIWAPKNLTEPKNQRFGLFLFLLTRPRGVRPRGPPIHIQGHSSPDGLGCNSLFSGRANRW